MAVHWKKGTEYPNVEALSEAFRDKRGELTRNLLLYWMVIIVLTVVVFILAPQWLTLAAGLVALVVAFGYVALRRRGYSKKADLIATGEFYWAAGKVQNKWKRGIIDISGGPAHQVGMSDEWVECDVSTHDCAEIGKTMVLVKKDPEDKNEAAVGIMIPDGGGFKQVKKIARGA